MVDDMGCDRGNVDLLIGFDDVLNLIARKRYPAPPTGLRGMVNTLIGIERDGTMECLVPRLSTARLAIGPFGLLIRRRRKRGGLRRLARQTQLGLKL